MKNKVTISFLLILFLLVGIIYGVIVSKYKIFPYYVIKNIYYASNANPGSWSIGIYEGSDPFTLNDPVNISNPVLTAKDVSDIDASFVADPFMIVENNKSFMFFEVMNINSGKGEIGYAESTNLKDWEYKKIVIDEPFHLSYPYVFKYDDTYYLIPESRDDLSVRLYKAISFPDKWEYVGNLLSGYRYSDPSLLRHNNKWWLFVATGGDILNLYYSDKLLGEWKPHKLNPIVKFNSKIARPGGRIINIDDKIYRFPQDGSAGYGTQVFAFEITELTESTYSEHIVSEQPVIKKSNKGWNATGMHHVDIHYIENKWVAAVDGKN